MKTTILRSIAYVAIAGAAVLGTGCQKEEATPETNQEQGRAPLTVTATIVATPSAEDTKTNLESTPNTLDTKSYLDATTMTAFWKTDDKIGISAIPSSGTDVVNKPFTLSSGADTKRGTFTEETQDPATTWPVGEAAYIAVYPYQSEATISSDPKVISLTYPHRQYPMQGADGDFSSGVMAARATSTGVPTDLSFQNLFSIIKISLTGTGTLTKVTFRDLSGKPVSGAYTVAVADGTVPVFPDTPIYDPDKTIELNLTLELSSTPQDIYLAVPPRVYGSGIEYVFWCGSYKMTKAMTASKTLEAGKYYTYSSSLAFAKDAPANLSADGTANCYIVTGAGYYSFTGNVIGNGTDGIIKQFNGATTFHTTSADIAPAYARLLWQDEEGLISDVAYAGGKVTFTASGKEGNAVIAVYEEDGINTTGDILWSWHIWCAEQPSNQVYKNAENKTFSLLDRNLGATSSDMMKGLLYQWGRKDPFLGGASATSDTEKTLYKSEGSTYTMGDEGYIVATDADKGTIANTIKNPATFYTNSSEPYDWHWYAGEETARKNDYLWGNPRGYDYGGTSGGGLIGGVVINPKKTIYDPCPLGYMVAPRDTWTYFSTSTGHRSGTGFIFNTNSNNETAWYPSAGSRTDNNGFLYRVDLEGYYWSSSPSDSEKYLAGSLCFCSVGLLKVSPLSELNRACGSSVRCCLVGWQ